MGQWSLGVVEEILYSAMFMEGVASELSSGVSNIYSTNNAFAALKADGSVVTWGSSGGDSSSAASELSSGVSTIYSNLVLQHLKTMGQWSLG